MIESGSPLQVRIEVLFVAADEPLGGGFGACRVWTDTAKDLDANEMAVELFREMIRRTVRDPAVAEALSPSKPAASP